MRAAELILEPRLKSVGRSSRRRPNSSYEQRLNQWGCFNCEFFEQRTFKSPTSSGETDSYAICRRAGEPIDLIWEATACPKNSDGGSGKDQRRRVRIGRRACKHAA